MTARGVINYIDSNPNEKILIFYGGAHLIDTKFSGNGAGGSDILTYEESMGYFLAYFLEQKYGEENVLKIVHGGAIYLELLRNKIFHIPEGRVLLQKEKTLGF